MCQVQHQGNCHIEQDEDHRPHQVQWYQLESHGVASHCSLGRSPHHTGHPAPTHGGGCPVGLARLSLPLDLTGSHLAHPSAPRCLPLSSTHSAPFRDFALAVNCATNTLPSSCMTNSSSLFHSQLKGHLFQVSLSAHLKTSPATRDSSPLCHFSILFSPKHMQLSVVIFTAGLFISNVTVTQMGHQPWDRGPFHSAIPRSSPQCVT